MTATDTAWAAAFWRDGRSPVDGPVAFGGSLSSGFMLAAYRIGLLPMACDRHCDALANEALYAHRLATDGIRLIGGPHYPYQLGWWSPDPRPILTARTVRLGSGLTKTLRSRRRWVTTMNQAFDRVLDGCRADRFPRWLTDDVVEVTTRLHAEGWYHSIEVWDGLELVGGAVGIGFGGVFSCDTMFHRRGGASQIALADLAVRLSTMAGVSPVLDLQWDSPHVRRLGAQFVRRQDYLALTGASHGRIAVPAHPRGVEQLLRDLRQRP